MTDRPTFRVRRGIGHRIARLTDRSHEDHMDLNTVLPWHRGVTKTAAPKRARAGWFYDTPAWDVLDPDQQNLLLWAETARDASMFIWLEQTLPPLYMGYVNAYGDALQKEVLEYLLVFSKEEIVHTQMFRRFMDLAGLTMFGPPEGLHRLFVEVLPTRPPLEGILATMLIEWVAECTAMHAVDGEGVEPLTHEMFVRHHREELRHIAFGRWLVSELASAIPAPERDRVRCFVEQLIDRAIRQSTVNVEIRSHVPFDLGISTGEGIETARHSTNNLRINAERYGRILTWLRREGLVRSEFRVSCMGEVG